MNLLILDDEIYTVRALQKSVDWKAAGIDTVEIAFNTEKARGIRECCRLHEKELIQGLDIVIVARPLAKEQGLMEIEEAFFHVGRKLNIFLESK